MECIFLIPNYIWLKNNQEENYIKFTFALFWEEFNGYIMALSMNILYFCKSKGTLIDYKDLSKYINTNY